MKTLFGLGVIKVGSMVQRPGHEGLLAFASPEYDAAENEVFNALSQAKNEKDEKLKAVNRKMRIQLGYSPETMQLYRELFRNNPLPRASAP